MCGYAKLCLYSNIQYTHLIVNSWKRDGCLEVSLSTSVALFVCCLSVSLLPKVKVCPHSVRIPLEVEHGDQTEEGGGGGAVHSALAALKLFLVSQMIRYSRNLKEKAM